MMALRRVGIILSCIAAASLAQPYAKALANELITIHASQVEGRLAYHQGFLQGVTSGVDRDLVAALAPRYWRLWDLSFGEVYDIALDAGAKVQVIVSNIYCHEQGGYPDCQPWEDWAGYESWLEDFVLQSPPVDYWDIWNEPDVTWAGTSADLDELYRRSYHVIRSVDPDSRLVGPSLAVFSEPILVRFLEFVDREGLAYAALSWHEIGDAPETVPGHVATMRARLADFPAFGDMEVHVNEYMSETTHLIPGWSVAWLYYLEIAGVDWANRSCWTHSMSSGFESECDQGLDGLLMFDEVTPQHAFWTHLVYAAMKEGDRLASESTSPYIVGLATKRDDLQEVVVLLGDYQQTSWEGVVTVMVEDYPYPGETVFADIYRIPTTDITGRLAEPDLIRVEVVPVSGGSATLTLDAVNAGEAYAIGFHP